MQNQSRPGPQSTGSSMPGTGSTGTSGSRSPQDELRHDAERVAGEVKQAAGSVKDEMVAAASDMRDQAAAMAEPLQQKARSLAEEQKEAGAQRVRGVARAISSAADELDDEMPQTAEWIRRGASRLETISTSVRDRSVEDLARDTERFARNNTAAFFGLSLVAGFALARFLKSGAASAADHGETTASGTGAPRYRTPSPPLQPQPGAPTGTAARSPVAAGAGATSGPRTGAGGRTDPTAFPHNEF
ncbi:hypothetical protein PQJ75_25375 [Rhodoplanes sp. TEM]|uniref:DUF3618 domain-containing protein n=1 Tax=Rhodoplanes tepidamans TaxID=200616 RepID=A0ABT5JCA6_RHOTP|nr:MULTISPECIES: hypothetical protein [Rhodoplanes]MDC7786680.1 hypothetical protein [Rhodoplanes tepidamans]MDC7987076.1 hypothetical protein [Rhodoplanes sp. TEM]MDQ0356355.1 uncharacterized protein YjbJ (UPF0337 family) [Rhodoplanes tepidamans]